MRIAIKQDLSPGLNSRSYTISGILKNKTKATTHPNIGSLMTATEKEWNKLSEELILKTCKSLQLCADRIIEKNGGHIE